MSEAEEIAELRKWMREDIGKLHDKLDERDRVLVERFDHYNEYNVKEHIKMAENIAEIDKRSEVKTSVIAAKISVFVTILTMVVATAVSAAINTLYG